ncbi:MAG TPA: LPXTG cell wall anchor domain-containing protein [Solirubrobacterales bacterium]|jgi:LPXTG-motif cell wall-anchored protein
MSRARLVALLAAFALLAPAAVASAHGGNPNYRSVITGVSPRMPGVEFEVLDYDSYMQLRDQHGKEVVIYGYSGEPYARILKNGTVEVNQRSPATYLNDSRFAEVTVPPIANAKAKPQWKTVDDSGTFIWHDHRMHYMSQSLPPQVKDKGRKTKVFDYEIPISVDGTNGNISGTLWWVGAANTSSTPFIVAGIAIVLIGGLLVLFVRRRRRGEGDDEGEGGEPEPRPDGTPETTTTKPAGEAW